jgi:hypothetical protein
MPWLFFVLESSLFGGVTPHKLRDFKGDIKVSLLTKELDINTHPHTKGFFNDSFNNSHENKKTSILQRFKQLCFGHCYSLG